MNLESDIKFEDGGKLQRYEPSINWNRMEKQSKKISSQDKNEL